MKPSSLPKVLCVDDEPAMLRALRLQLGREFEVAVATDAVQALALLRGDRFDVILSDQRMPGLCGTEFLQRAKVLAPHAVRLLMTGYADFNAVVSALNEGDVFRFVSKPWDPLKLLASVQEAARLARMSRMGWADFQDTRPRSLGDALPELLLVQADAGLAAQCEAASEGLASPIVAHDAADALTLLAQRRVALVLLHAPGPADGALALARALRRRRPRPAVVVCSAARDTAGLQRLINNGLVHRFLPLPTTPDRLRRLLETALRPPPLPLDTGPATARAEAPRPAPPPAEPERPLLAAPWRARLAGWWGRRQR